MIPVKPWWNRVPSMVVKFELWTLYILQSNIYRDKLKTSIRYESSNDHPKIDEFYAYVHYKVQTLQKKGQQILTKSETP